MKFACVTGMHRSGTSVATSLIGHLGVDLGPPGSFLAARPDNPMGYFESREITRLNDATLRMHGAEWDSPPRFAPGWELAGDLADTRKRAGAIISETFDGSGPAAWKDPRMCILLPLWRSVVQIDRVVLLVRHPAQVVESLAKRDGMDAEHAYGLWVRYTADGWWNGGDPMVLPFDDLFERPRVVARRLSTYLDLRMPRRNDRRMAKDMVVGRLRHHAMEKVGSGHNARAADQLYNAVLGSDRAGLRELCSELREAWS